MQLNFFREPSQHPGARVRLIFGGVGAAMALVLALVYPANWLFALLGELVFLHYLFAGLAESLPREQTRAAGVLRILSLLVSLFGMIGAVIVLATL
jgi:hypothetical protein